MMNSAILTHSFHPPLMHRRLARCCVAFFLGCMAPLIGAQGVTADTILLGQSAALSGPAEALGKEMKAGAEAYFKVVNDAGGIN